MLKPIALLSTCALSALAMHTAEININNKDIEAGFRFDMAQQNYAIDPETYMFGLHIISGDPDHSDAVDIEPLYEVNFLLQNRLTTNRDLRIGMGIKFEYTKLNSATYMALPLGIEASYRLPIGSVLPVNVGASFYFAPEVLSFNKAQNYMEYRIYTDIEVIKYGYITLGYRNIRTDLTYRDMDYNDAMYAGFKFSF